jgi:hypothetical protein
VEFVEFTHREIADLADKISEAAHVLTDKERVLLLAIFAIAADQAQLVDPEQGIVELPAARIDDPEVTRGELKLQLLRAYTPGKFFDEVHKSRKTVIGGMPPSATPAAAAPAPEAPDPTRDQQDGGG